MGEIADSFDDPFGGDIEDSCRPIGEASDDGSSQDR
jgi:hypothetical protein